MLSELCWPVGRAFFNNMWNHDVAELFAGVVLDVAAHRPSGYADRLSELAQAEAERGLPGLWSVDNLFQFVKRLVTSVTLARGGDERILFQRDTPTSVRLIWSVLLPPRRKTGPAYLTERERYFVYCGAGPEPDVEGRWIGELYWHLGDAAQVGSIPARYRLLASYCTSVERLTPETFPPEIKAWARFAQEATKPRSKKGTRKRS